MYRYKTQQWLNTDIRGAWNFFSSPNNLALITPKEMDFKICLNPNDKSIYNGMNIHYRLKPLLGLPVNWTTEIIDVKEEERFTDVQKKGPYKKWEHTHYFKQEKNGILMTDEIKYELPLGILGRIMHFILIRKKIRAIFEYRREIVNQLFT